MIVEKDTALTIGKIPIPGVEDTQIATSYSMFGTLNYVKGIILDESSVFFTLNGYSITDPQYTLLLP